MPEATAVEIEAPDTEAVDMVLSDDEEQEQTSKTDWSIERLLDWFLLLAFSTFHDFHNIRLIHFQSALHIYSFGA